MKKRGALEIGSFFEAYSSVIRRIYAVQQDFPERILVVPYAKLARDTQKVMEKVCRFIGLEDGIDLSLDRYNARFGKLVESRNSFDSSKLIYTEPKVELLEEELNLLRELSSELPNLIIASELQ